MHENQTHLVASGSPRFAGEESLSESDQSELQLALSQVADQKHLWANTDCQQRIELLDALVETLKSSAENWVAAGCEAKGLASGSPSSGEEWLAGPCVVARNIRLLRDSIRQITRYGKPQLPGQPYVRSGGQVVAPVMPTNLFDQLLFMGFKAEVRMEPDVTIDELPETMAVAYDEMDSKPGSVCLVLGAGNVSSIGPLDALYKLFVENQVVVLKMNPVNDYLAEHYKIALQPLIRDGFLRIVQGGNRTGQWLCEHPSVDEIHVTGSDKTHDAIVYGTGSDGADRKLRRDPVCRKRVTSELGNVSPVIIVPGKWSKSDIIFQAQNVASMLVNNAGFNCAAIRILITYDHWPQRDDFLRAVKSAFEKIPARQAYYPGAAKRFETFTSARSNVSRIGGRDDGLPWALIHDLDSENLREICFSSEAFCSLMGETQLKGNTVEQYLSNAVEFANSGLWGSLNVTLIAKPTSIGKNSAVAAAFEQAIADLRFGTVAVNHWAGLNIGLGCTTWGAFPGHPPHDIQSGTGVVHNTYMFDRPQKTVLRGPFRTFPKTPVWFANHAKTHKVGPALFKFECSPSWFRLPAVFINALG